MPPRCRCPPRLQYHCLNSVHLTGWSAPGPTPVCSLSDIKPLPSLLVSTSQGLQQGSAPTTGLCWCGSVAGLRVRCRQETAPGCFMPWLCLHVQMWHLRRTQWDFAPLPHLYSVTRRQTLQSRTQCRCWHRLRYCT